MLETQTLILRGIKIENFDEWSEVNEDYAREFERVIQDRFGVSENLTEFRKISNVDVLYFSNVKRTRGYVFVNRLVVNPNPKKTLEDKILKYLEMGAKKIKKIEEDNCFMWEVDDGKYC